MKTHPLYNAMQKVWILCQDCYDGEGAVKTKGELYLPPTSGQRADGYPKSGTQGLHDYEAYKLRAVFPETYSEAVASAVGIMHRKEAGVELPDQLEYLKESATTNGETLVNVLRRINDRQLVTGRVGVLADAVVNPITGDQLKLMVYNEKTILNWFEDNQQLAYVSLDQSGYKQDPSSMDWEYENRTLHLGLVKEENGVRSFGQGGIYMAMTETEESEFDIGKMEPVTFYRTIKEIPFVIANINDTDTMPCKPPLLGLAYSLMAIYRGEADYRQNLHMQSQETLVLKNSNAEGNDPIRTGAGACISVGKDGDAKFIGVSAAGLAEQGKALENDYKRATIKATQIPTESSDAESGEALAIRVAAQTASLPRIALTAASALTQLLKICARWVGANEDKVSIRPNLEFTSRITNTQSLKDLQDFKANGGIISNTTIHQWMVDNGISTMTFEEEQKLVNAEPPLPTHDTSRRQIGELLNLNEREQFKTEEEGEGE